MLAYYVDTNEMLPRKRCVVGLTAFLATFTHARWQHNLVSEKRVVQAEDEDDVTVMVMSWWPLVTSYAVDGRNLYIVRFYAWHLWLGCNLSIGCLLIARTE